MTLQTLIKKADTWFSRSVRLKASDNQGVGRCITCGKFKEVKYMDCGHYFSRRHMSVRYNRINTALQCKLCNKDMGRPEINDRFYGHILHEHGPKALTMLEIAKNKVRKWSVFELELLISECKNEVKNELIKKGLIKWW